MLAHNLGFTAVAVIVLALGICASVTIFTFVDAALIPPLPYSNPAGLVDVTESIGQIPRANLSYQDYLDWKKFNKAFTSFAVCEGSGYLLRTPSGVQPVSGARVSDGFFRTLGVTPIMGRDFYHSEGLSTEAVPQGLWPAKLHENAKLFIFSVTVFFYLAFSTLGL
jgi:hypothetical protein